MKEEKLKKIVNHNEYKREEILEACYKFYTSIGRKSPTVLPDIQTVAGMIFADKGYKLIRIPLKNKEIGAFQLRLNGLNYLVLNTAKTLAYNNYSLAHELYHILIQKEELNSLDIFKEEYSDDENELMANAFAGNILMPEEDFVLISNRFLKIISGLDHTGVDDFFDQYFLITVLMNYFRTTYMSVLVRCFELRIFDINNDNLVKNLLINNKKENLLELCNNYAISLEESSIAEVSNVDDFEILLKDATRQGEEKIKRGLLTREDFEYKIQGMKRAHEEVVGNKCQ